VASLEAKFKQAPVFTIPDLAVDLGSLPPQLRTMAEQLRETMAQMELLYSAHKAAMAKVVVDKAASAKIAVTGEVPSMVVDKVASAKIAVTREAPSRKEQPDDDEMEWDEHSEAELRALAEAAHPNFAEKDEEEESAIKKRIARVLPRS